MRWIKKACDQTQRTIFPILSLQINDACNGLVQRLFVFLDAPKCLTNMHEASHTYVMLGIRLKFEVLFFNRLT